MSTEGSRTAGPTGILAARRVVIGLAVVAVSAGLAALSVACLAPTYESRCAVLISRSSRGFGSDLPVAAAPLAPYVGAATMATYACIAESQSLQTEALARVGILAGAVRVHVTAVDDADVLLVSARAGSPRAAETAARAVAAELLTWLERGRRETARSLVGVIGVAGGASPAQAAGVADGNRLAALVEACGPPGRVLGPPDRYASRRSPDPRFALLAGAGAGLALAICYLLWPLVWATPRDWNQHAREAA